MELKLTTMDTEKEELKYTASISIDDFIEIITRQNWTYKNINWASLVKNPP